MITYFVALWLVGGASGGAAAAIGGGAIGGGAGGVSRKTPVVEAVQRVGPAVVAVFTKQKVERSPFFSSHGLFDELFGGPRPRDGGLGLGSGIIIDAKGLVLTNAHVVLNAAQIQVQLDDGREFEAQVLGLDQTFDIAVLRLKKVTGSLPAVGMGQSKDLMIGESAIAIGNPLGLSHTVTTGVISALHRTVPIDEDHAYDDLIQTDALINPGNSGGPLLNINGELIGINSAIRVGQGASYAFAIPIDRARAIVEDLQRFGHVRVGWIGATCRDIRGPGCAIAEVENGGPAAQAGLKPGDLVLAVGSERVINASDFASRVSHVLDGEEVLLKVDHRGPIKIRATYLEPSKVVDRARKRLGIEVASVRGGGAEVTRVVRGSACAEIGIRPGDVFVQVGQHEIETADQFWKAVGQLRPGGQATFVIQRGYYQYVVPIPM